MANPDAIFLHCLPAFHDTNTTIGADIAERFGVTEMEVEDEVFESKASRSSTRPRTACTPSRPSCTPPSAANLPRTCFIGASESAAPAGSSGRGQALRPYDLTTECFCAASSSPPET